MRSAPLTGTATPITVRIFDLIQLDAIRAPHGDCNVISVPLLYFKCRCDPRPSRGLQHQINNDDEIKALDATRAPHGDKRKTACQVEGIPFLFFAM